MNTRGIYISDPCHLHVFWLLLLLFPMFAQCMGNVRLFSIFSVADYKLLNIMPCWFIFVYNRNVLYLRKKNCFIQGHLYNWIKLVHVSENSIASTYVKYRHHAKYIIFKMDIFAPYYRCYLVFFILKEKLYCKGKVHLKKKLNPWF